MLRRELGRRTPRKGERASEHLLIDDGQAVLVAAAAGTSFKHLGRRIDRRQAAHHRNGRIVDVLHQAEVGHLDPSSHQQQVLGLDVQMLQPVLLVHVVQGVGRVAKVAKQLLPRDARQPFFATLLEAVLQAALCQLGDDQQLSVDDLDPLQREEERMADPLDAVERFEFAGRAVLVQEAVDELDRFGELAGGFGRPHFAIATRPDPLHKLIAGDRLLSRAASGGGGHRLRAPWRRPVADGMDRQQRERSGGAAWHPPLRLGSIGSLAYD